jgi:hypothetical protein
MQKQISTLIALILLTLSVQLIGCGGKAKLGPDWFLNTPDDKDYIYAAATDTSSNMQYAIDKASSLARDQIANTTGTKVMSMFKRFREEVGESETPEFMTMTTNVSKQVVSEVLNGTKVAKKEVAQKGNVFQAYVLMSMPIGEANSALMARLKANQNLYTRYRASQAFKELNDDVEKYEKFKREQGL